MASISSMKIIEGADVFAWPKRSRTLLAPTPTSISINSLPAILKNGTPASPATAFAKSVLPTPAGPKRSAPLGVRAPIFLYFAGFFKKSTSSSSSFLASSTPATSAKVVSCFPLAKSLALLLPNEKISCAPLLWALMIKKKNTAIRIRGKRIPRISPKALVKVWSETVYLTPDRSILDLSKRSAKLSLLSLIVYLVEPSL